MKQHGVSCWISVCSDELSLSLDFSFFMFDPYVNCVHRWTLMTYREHNAHCSILRWKRDTCTAQVMSWLCVSTACLSWESSQSQTAVSVSLACFVTVCESQDAQVFGNRVVVLRLQQGALVVGGFAKICLLLNASKVPLFAFLFFKGSKYGSLLLCSVILFIRISLLI